MDEVCPDWSPPGDSEECKGSCNAAGGDCILPADREKWLNCPHRNRKNIAGKHDRETLPKWARDHISALEREIDTKEDTVKRLESADYILKNREWFTLNSGRAKDDTGPRKFYTVSGGTIVLMATCGKDDLILIGRAKRERDNGIQE